MNISQKATVGDILKNDVSAVGVGLVLDLKSDST